MDLESALTVVGTDGYDACAALSISILLFAGTGISKSAQGQKAGGGMDLSVRMRR